MSSLETIAAVLVVTAIFAAGLLYVLFCQAPEKRWKDRVIGLWARAQRQRQQENAFLRQAGENLQREEKNLADRVFHSLLEKLAVERLEAFPGIGSGTTSRLRQSGYTNLARLQRARIQIHGLGQKRLADIHGAVDKLTRETWKRFQEDPNCAEKADLAMRLQSLRRDFQEREFISRARAQSMDAFLKRLQGMVQAAEEIRFISYLGLAKKAVIAPEYLNAQLPNLEDHLRAVEAEAARAWRQRQGNLREESPTPVQHLDIMELTVQLAFAVARTDRRVAQAEKAVIAEHVEKRYANDAALKNRARALCAHYESAPINVDDCLRRIREQFAVPDRTALMSLAVEIAAASGGFNGREQEFLDKVSRVLEVPLPRPPQVVRSNVAVTPGVVIAPSVIAQPNVSAKPGIAAKPEALPITPAEVELASTSDPRALLEIDAATELTAELIRRHFNRLWDRFDPEKMAGMGGDFVAMAHAKRAALRAAAGSLIAPFGQDLEPKAAPAPPRDIRDNPDLDQVFGV